MKAKITKMGDDPKKVAPKKEKRPLVNWFKRTKEVEFSTKKVGDKDVNVKTKVVKAPESVLSKGFEKKKVVESVKRKDPNLFKKIGGAIGGLGLAVSGTENREKNRALKRLDKIKDNPKFSQSNKDGYKTHANQKSKSSKTALAIGLAAPIVGIAIDKARGKTKVISKTKTKVVTPRKK